MTDAETFESVIRWYNQIMECKDCPIIILGNKCDLQDKIKVTSDDLAELASLGYKCYETSVVSNHNVEEAFI